MNPEKIKKLEKDIRSLHYDPIRAKHGFSKKSTREIFTDFWDYHVSFVVKTSKKLGVKYEADENILWTAAILHDIARLDEAEPHDEIGAEKALAMLVKRGFDQVFSQKVKDVILTHRCKQYPPQNVEQKILATADAMSHFLTPFYLWIAKDADQGLDEMLKKNLAKIERDYNDKIFFEDEKKEIEIYYEVIKNWCQYKNKS